MTWTIELSVGDHIQNGWMGLARWTFPSEQAAMAMVDRVNALFPKEAEPDHKVDDFTFCLDIHDCDIVEDGPQLVDNSRNLPLQIAMLLAPDQVLDWLNTRPNPNAEPFCNFYGVLLPTPALAEAQAT